MPDNRKYSKQHPQQEAVGVNLCEMPEHYLEVF